MILGAAKFPALFNQKVNLMNLHSIIFISVPTLLFHCSQCLAHVLIYFEFQDCSMFHNRKAHPLTSSFYMARCLVIFPWHRHKWWKTYLPCRTLKIKSLGTISANVFHKIVANIFHKSNFFAALLKVTFLVTQRITDFSTLYKTKQYITKTFFFFFKRLFSWMAYMFLFVIH